MLIVSNSKYNKAVDRLAESTDNLLDLISNYQPIDDQWRRVEVDNNPTVLQISVLAVLLLLPLIFIL